MKAKLIVVLALIFSPFFTKAQNECLDPSWPNSVVLSANMEGMVTIYPSSALVSQTFYFPGTNAACFEDGCSTWFIDNFSAEPFELTYSINGVNTVLNLEPFTSQAFVLNLGEGVAGCTITNACNYNPQATCDDGTCTYDCYGCTDSAALNYNASSTIDDGSCCYNENAFFSIEADGSVFVTAYGMGGNSTNDAYYPAESGFCLTDNCVEFYVLSLDATPVQFTITHVSSGASFTGTAEGYYQTVGYLSTTGTVGCADPSACNYDPNTTCANYYICDYSCLGCTDPTAVNFNESATIDNGSCCYSEDWVTLTSNVAAYFNIYATDGSYYYTNQFFEDFQSSFCLPDGCFNIELYPMTGEYVPIEVSVIGANGDVWFTTVSNGSLVMDSFTKNGVPGCVDTAACNFDPNATCGNSLLCDYGCYGCTDPNADNYDADATIDNGACCYGQYTVVADAPIHWSTYNYNNYWNGYFGSTPEQNAFCPENGCYVFYAGSSDGSQVPFTLYDGEGNVVISALTDDPMIQGHSFEVNAISGCMDPMACTYDPNANCYNWSSCDYSCYGCTDPQAPNFDPSATLDNGTCCVNNWYNVNVDGEAYFWAQSYSTYESAGGMTPLQTGFCMSSDCFDFSIYSYGPGTVDFTLTDQDGSVLLSGNTADSFGYFTITGGEIFGCTDPNACNFDPAATCSNWYACDYNCYGCTDSSAPNFDPTATFDDGTCCTANWYTFNSSGTFYWSVYDANSGGYAWGIYPEQNGFCNNGECVSLQVWDINGGSAEYTLLNAAGEIVSSGSTSTSWYVTTPISFDGDIPGCTDQTACNYDPNATCDAGNCDYYCGGCTDITALNYNQNAYWNDGSCIYSVEPPQIAVSTEESPFALDEYYVRINVVSTGNGSPYMTSSDISNEAMMITETGTYMMGPFPCDENAMINIHSASLGMSSFNMSDPVVSPCFTTVGTDEVNEAVNSLNVYPNPTNGNVTISGLNESVSAIRLFDYTGREVAQWSGQQWNGTTTFDLSDYSNGYYQIQIVSNGGVETKSLVIKK